MTNNILIKKPSQTEVEFEVILRQLARHVVTGNKKYIEKKIEFLIGCFSSSEKQNQFLEHVIFPACNILSKRNLGPQYVSNLLAGACGKCKTIDLKHLVLNKIHEFFLKDAQLRLNTFIEAAQLSSSDAKSVTEVMYYIFNCFGEETKAEDKILTFYHIGKDKRASPLLKNECALSIIVQADDLNGSLDKVKAYVSAAEVAPEVSVGRKLAVYAINREAALLPPREAAFYKNVAEKYNMPSPKTVSRESVSAQSPLLKLIS